MYIIAGKYKGLKLNGPKKSKTRPIMSFAKERLFNIIGVLIQDKKILDLYAGTGAIGIEALSRGCKHVTFVEKNFSAYNVIKRNIDKCNEYSNTSVVIDDVISYIKRNVEVFDIIFSSPPYNCSYYFNFLTIIDNNVHVLNESGHIIIECNIHTKGNFELNNIFKYKEFKCDDTVFEFWMQKTKTV